MVMKAFKSLIGFINPILIDNKSIIKPVLSAQPKKWL